MPIGDYHHAVVLAAPATKALLDKLPNDGAVARFLANVRQGEDEEDEEDEK